MFRQAYQIAIQYTFPTLQYHWTVEGKCSAGAAAIVVVNSDGWILTAAHVMQEALALGHAERAAKDHEAARAQIVADASLSNKERSRKLSALGSLNKRAVRRAGVNWGFDNVTLRDIKILPAADLALGRLDGFDKTKVSKYPVFKDPLAADFMQGASLCKLGYPFVELTPTYDEQKNFFGLPPDQVGIPFFPIEGMYTRRLTADPVAGLPYPVLFIETSSPGLRGQSGGPTFDPEGRIWAIQSMTRHLPLGFSPEIKHLGKMEREHQFLNVGMGASSETVLGFLNQHGIKHEVA